MKIKDIYVLFILLSFLSSLISFRLDFERPYKIFSLLLLLTLLVEASGIYIAKILHKPNLALYNSFPLIQYPAYAYFYLQFLQSKKAKQYVKIITGIFLIIAITNLLFIQGFGQLSSYTLVAACIMMLLLSLFYFRQLLHSVPDVVLSRDPVFWITVGMIIFHLGSLPFFSLMNYLKDNFFWTLSNSLLMIVKILICIMHCLFIIGFLCRINIRKYSY